MRQIYSYQTIRYFPHVLSDEFINVGVILNSANRVRILSEEEAKSIYCSAFIGEKKRFLALIEHLHKLASDNVLLEKHYFHNFRFSEEKTVASEKREDELLEELFEDYIGFKIKREEKKDLKELILEQSIKVAESSDFRNYIRIRRTPVSEFDFEIESIKKEILHQSAIGKTTLKHDVTRIVMATPDYKEHNKRYDFLNINGKINPENKYVKKLIQNYIEPYPYKTKEDVANYFELIAS